MPLLALRWSWGPPSSWSGALDRTRRLVVMTRLSVRCLNPLPLFSVESLGVPGVDPLCLFGPGAELCFVRPFRRYGP